MEFNFNIVLSNLPILMDGLKITLLSFTIALAIGFPLGLILCGMRLRKTGFAAHLAQGYVAVFRAIPEMVMIFWMFYCLPPLIGFKLSGLTSGSLALGLVSGAYLCEIFRGAVQSVAKGQWEVSDALALPRRAVWLRVITPQAAKLAIPPFINHMTELLKGTTLLATIGVAELALRSYVLGAQTFRYFEFLTAIALIYFVVIFPVARFAEHIERKLAKATS
jgi:His/Glu/Gln/Arg/opine family amino acid ABC transporter permease subunit